MPSKKKKYNARFPAGRIKKIMQTDEEVGKVAQAVPVIISRTLELFVESLLTKTLEVTMSKSAKTLSPSHMKQCILSESRFDFLKDLVKTLPDSAPCEEEINAAPALPASPLAKPGHQIFHTPHTPANHTERVFVQLPQTERNSNPLSTNFDARLYPSAPAVCQNSTEPTDMRRPVNANFYSEQLSSYLVTQSPRSSPPTLVVDEDYDT